MNWDGTNTNYRKINTKHPAYFLHDVSITKKYEHFKGVVFIVSVQIDSVIYRFNFCDRPIMSFCKSDMASPEVLDYYPLSMDDKIKKMTGELSNMTSAEKWELIEKSFGMWSDYPDDWLDNLRSGNLKIQGIADSNSDYGIFS